MNKKRLLKLADFIEKLPNRKLEMENIADLNGSEKMDPHKCGSTACAMGWTPAVFPRLVRWSDSEVRESAMIVIFKKDHSRNTEAMKSLFDISLDDCDYIFGPGTDRYHTPKQVARGIRRYVKNGEIPKCMKDQEE